METEAPVRVAIRDDADVVIASQNGRTVAQRIGMSASTQSMIATAISELARNIVSYAGRGEVMIRVIDAGDRRGVEVEASDEGPGIEDADRAMQDGISSANSLGLGLPGARRLMDEFSLRSAPNEGTTVTMCKWAPGR